MTTVATHPSERPADTAAFTRPVPFTRLVAVHLRIWPAQRAMTAATLVAVLIGVASMLFTLGRLHAGATATEVVRQFGTSAAAYSLLWSAIGAVAGAGPFRNKWAQLLLTFAPRRGRWFAAMLASVLIWTVAAAGLFTVLCAALVLIRTGSAGAATAVVTNAGPVVVASLFAVTVGLVLGAAARGVAVPLVLAYVIAPTLPLISVHGVHLGALVDLGGAADHLAAGTVGWHDLTALCAWIVAPAALALWRLGRGA